MKNIFCLILLIICSIVTFAFATPPKEMKINYSAHEGILHIQADHPSSRLERHYLRRLVIYINDIELKTVYYPRQVIPSGFEADVDVKAKAGDRITAKLSCSQGGEDKAETIVEEIMDIKKS